MNKGKKIILFLVLCLSGFFAKAQEKQERSDAWFLLLNHYNINEKWSVGNEFHWRQTNFLSDKSQLILRPFVNYKINKNVIATAGYSYLLNFADTNPASDVNLPEHNIWEQVTLKHSSGKLKFSHRYRVEHRFRGTYNADLTEIEEYKFTNRGRYRLTLKHPIGEKYFVHVFDELWFNLGENFDQVDFDRNWLYLGLGRKVFDHGNIQLGYVHQYIKSNNDLYFVRPTVQLTVQYDFN
ncbi:DUF2490 domain-containing protein [Aureivirga sp. CE67]|uniref:DUF2490 domain-containing protein n=1 Tax=Aureivirga sp. CE67 TaxID=1788983 RepID=UPI0018CA1EF6|nr:DUF2490 domain-containing protein [Aureivirga sp. CE67]